MGFGACRHCGYPTVAYGAEACPGCGGPLPHPEHYEAHSRQLELAKRKENVVDGWSCCGCMSSIVFVIAWIALPFILDWEIAIGTLRDATWPFLSDVVALSIGFSIIIMLASWSVGQIHSWLVK